MGRLGPSKQIGQCDRGNEFSRQTFRRSAGSFTLLFLISMVCDWFHSVHAIAEQRDQQEILKILHRQPRHACFLFSPFLGYFLYLMTKNTLFYLSYSKNYLN